MLLGVHDSLDATLTHRFHKRRGSRAADERNEVAPFHCQWPPVLRPKGSTPQHRRRLLRCGISIWRMSALGQERTLHVTYPMSALPLKADKARTCWHVRFVPKADLCTAAKATLFDHLIGDREHARRDGEAERLGSFQVDDQLELGRLQRR